MKSLRHSLLVLTLGLLFAGFPSARADFQSEVLGDGAKGFWLLNDGPTTANDSTPNNFNGTYGAGVTPQGIAGPAWVTGPGLVADFDGTGQISFAAPLNLGANGYTIEAWIRPTLYSLQNTTRIVASSAIGLSGYGFGTASGSRLLFTSFSQQDYFTTGPTLQLNQWQYVGVVLDTNNNAHFYVNGAFVETVLSTDGSTITPVGNFTIGSRSPLPIGEPDEFFRGGLAGVSVYDTTLTAGQIQDQYNAGLVPEPSSAVLIGLAAMGVGGILRPRPRTKTRHVEKGE